MARRDLADAFSAKIGTAPTLVEQKQIRLQSEGHELAWLTILGGGLFFRTFFELFRLLGDQNPEIVSRYSPIRPGAQESLKIGENRSKSLKNVENR